MKLRKFRRGERGFTLVELLIAVGILALLAGIAVPVVAHLRGGSDTDAAAGELANIQAAIDSLMAVEEVSSFATTSPDSSTANALADTVGEATQDMTKLPYTDGDWALCPASGTKYIRQSSTTHKYYLSTDGTVTQIIV